MMKLYRNNTLVYFLYAHATMYIFTTTKQPTHVHHTVLHEMVLTPIIPVYGDFEVKLELRTWLERLCNVKKNK